MFSTRTIVSGRHLVTSIPKLAQRRISQPWISRNDQQYRYLHPEKRLEESRKKALEFVKAQVAAKGQKEQEQIKQQVQRDSLHPEKRLEESRQRALDFVNAQVAQKEKERQNDENGGAKKPVSAVCEANGHPDFRLRVKREEASLAISKQSINNIFSRDDDLDTKSNSKTSIITQQSIRVRLESAKEKARLRIKTFEPWVKPKPAIVPIMITSTEQPPQKRNDGTSSGALTERRLRGKREEALEKIMAMQQSQE